MPDRTWLDELYQQQKRPLFLTAWNILRCSSLAEDAVHSAFVHLAELRKAPREPKLYAFRAVRNAAIDCARGRARRREEPMPAEAAQHLGPTSDGNEMLTTVAAALDQLDDSAREVIELHLHSGLTFREIAFVLEAPLQTIASRYRRALEKLRQSSEVCRERS